MTTEAQVEKMDVASLKKFLSNHNVDLSTVESTGKYKDKPLRKDYIKAAVAILQQQSSQQDLQLQNSRRRKAEPHKEQKSQPLLQPQTESQKEPPKQTPPQPQQSQQPQQPQPQLQNTLQQQPLPQPQQRPQPQTLPPLSPSQQLFQQSQLKAYSNFPFLAQQQPYGITNTAMPMSMLMMLSQMSPEQRYQQQQMFEEQARVYQYLQQQQYQQQQQKQRQQEQESEQNQKQLLQEQQKQYPQIQQSQEDSIMETMENLAEKLVHSGRKSISQNAKIGDENDIPLKTSGQKKRSSSDSDAREVPMVSPDNIFQTTPIPVRRRRKSSMATKKSEENDQQTKPPVLYDPKNDEEYDQQEQNHMQHVTPSDWKENILHPSINVSYAMPDPLDAVKNATGTTTGQTPHAKSGKKSVGWINQELLSAGPKLQPTFVQIKTEEKKMVTEYLNASSSVNPTQSGNLAKSVPQSRGTEIKPEMRTTETKRKLTSTDTEAKIRSKTEEEEQHNEADQEQEQEQERGSATQPMRPIAQARSAEELENYNKLEILNFLRSQKIPGQQKMKKSELIKMFEERYLPTVSQNKGRSKETVHRSAVPSVAPSDPARKVLIFQEDEDKGDDMIKVDKVPDMSDQMEEGVVGMRKGKASEDQQVDERMAENENEDSEEELINENDRDGTSEDQKTKETPSKKRRVSYSSEKTGRWENNRLTKSLENEAKNVKAGVPSGHSSASTYRKILMAIAIIVSLYLFVMLLYFLYNSHPNKMGYFFKFSKC